MFQGLQDDVESTRTIDKGEKVTELEVYSINQGERVRRKGNTQNLFKTSRSSLTIRSHSIAERTIVQLKEYVSVRERDRERDANKYIHEISSPLL